MKSGRSDRRRVQVTSFAMQRGGAGAFHWSPVAGGLFTFDATQLRSSHPTHLHTWYSIYVVTAGSVCIHSRGREWTATPGMVVLLSPYETHAEFYDAREGCSYRGVYPTHERLCTVLGDTLSSDAFIHFRHSVVDHPGLAAKVLWLCESLWQHAASDQYRATSDLFGALLRERSDSDACFSHGEHRAITLVRQYLREPHLEPPTMRRISAIAGLSRFHLSRLFRDASGLSPYAYYAQVRLARAQYLLHAGASVTRAASALGFTDQSHFTRQFGARLSTTPGRYARAVRGALASGAASRLEGRE